MYNVYIHVMTKLNSISHCSNLQCHIILQNHSNVVSKKHLLLLSILKTAVLHSFVENMVVYIVNVRSGQKNKNK